MKEKFVKYGFVLGYPVEYIAESMRGKEEEREWILNKFSIVNKREKLKDELLKEFENLKVTEIELEDPVSDINSILNKETVINWDCYSGALLSSNFYLKMSHVENIIYVMRDINYPTGATIFITPDYTMNYATGDESVRYWKEKRK